MATQYYIGAMPLRHGLAVEITPTVSDKSHFIRYFMATSGVGTFALLTRLLLSKVGTFNLHVLGLEPAFILSQDQTHFYYPYISNVSINCYNLRAWPVY